MLIDKQLLMHIDFHVRALACFNERMRGEGSQLFNKIDNIVFFTGIMYSSVESN